MTQTTFVTPWAANRACTLAHMALYWAGVPVSPLSPGHEDEPMLVTRSGSPWTDSITRTLPSDRICAAIVSICAFTVLLPPVAWDQYLAGFQLMYRIVPRPAKYFSSAVRVTFPTSL